MSKTGYCPHCGSTQVSGSKPGGGVSRASCLRCGHSWQEDLLREAPGTDQKDTAWKEAFYEAYEAEDYGLAEELYQRRHGGFGEKAANVHEAYEQELRKDNRRVREKLLATTLLAAISVLLWQVLSC